MRTPLAASVLGLALVAGCATQGQKNVAKTSSSLGDVKTELITDKNDLIAATDALNELVYAPGVDLRPQYNKFVRAVEALEASAASSQASAKSMVKDREVYLSKWRSDAASMSDPDLRMRAIDRIRDTEANFANLSGKIIAADNALSPAVKDLRAIQMFLDNDLTANGIKTISDRATKAKNNATTVNQKIDAAIMELDKVSDQIAPMPTTQSAS